MGKIWDRNRQIFPDTVYGKTTLALRLKAKSKKNMLLAMIDPESSSPLPNPCPTQFIPPSKCVCVGGRGRLCSCLASLGIKPTTWATSPSLARHFSLESQPYMVQQFRGIHHVLISYQKIDDSIQHISRVSASIQGSHVKSVINFRVRTPSGFPSSPLPSSF